MLHEISSSQSLPLLAIVELGSNKRVTPFRVNSPIVHLVYIRHNLSLSLS
nr:MAG TPA: hypothetical protein [Caudoviricetes sp.]DAU06769.1 MAG TPA: hypothetical protein [Caudoviricetes sp.]